ncbi:hypothetical protein MPH_11045 [Macrophomina phaseolina MS6]|uniref:Uncharacterized protein n=1 Tax=Macrophomina phaseolina (strain MS6) TaxID=1126212 RepID=K2RFE1_MACPH|nr:hypothetical protein MPH_11045 [Macrophomina phaseolina MS6]
MFNASTPIAQMPNPNVAQIMARSSADMFRASCHHARWSNDEDSINDKSDDRDSIEYQPPGRGNYGHVESGRAVEFEFSDSSGRR